MLDVHMYRCTYLHAGTGTLYLCVYLCSYFQNNNSQHTILTVHFDCTFSCRWRIWSFSRCHILSFLNCLFDLTLTNKLCFGNGSLLYFWTVPYELFILLRFEKTLIALSLKRALRVFYTTRLSFLGKGSYPSRSWKIPGKLEEKLHGNVSLLTKKNFRGAFFYKKEN